MKKIVLFLLFLTLNISFYAKEKFEFDPLYKKTHHDFWNTARKGKTYLRSYKNYAILAKKYSNAPVQVEYAYSLYYHVTYYLYLNHQEEFKKTRVPLLEESIAVFKEVLSKKEKMDTFHQSLLFLGLGLAASELAPIKSSISNANLAKKSFEEGLSFNRHFYHRLFLIALGRLYFKVPGILFGNKEKAQTFLQEAGNENPPILFYYWHQAEMLINNRELSSLPSEEKSKVLQLLKKGLAKSPVIPEDRFALKQMQLLQRSILKSE